MKIQKNGMTFTVLPEGGFTCDDLAGLPAAFEERWSSEEIQDDTARHLAALRGLARPRFVSDEERDAVPEGHRKALGEERFDEVVASLRARVCDLDPFQQFVFWISHWWHFLDGEAEGICVSFIEAQESSKLAIRERVFPLFPRGVQRAVMDADFLSVAVGGGHFAMLFGGTSRRLIVTDTQLFELRDVHGYSYLGITAEGLPVARSRCNRFGGRAWFDGRRLMAHPQFQTCAPGMVVIDGGYKVNTTRATIVNGAHYALVDEADAVAHTTGSAGGPWGATFTSAEGIQSIALARQSGERMRVEEGRVKLDGRELKPFGMFTPSSVQLLDNGFALYGWSDYHEIVSIRYDRVIIVDDRSDWIDSVVSHFADDDVAFEVFCTDHAGVALSGILRSEPDAVLLDMHLTDEERFDGLWIANELAKREFSGRIMITSGSGLRQLQAMQALIHVATDAPGKDLDRIQLALCGRLSDE